MPGQSGSLKELLCLFKDTVLEALDFSRGRVHAYEALLEMAGIKDFREVHELRMKQKKGIIRRLFSSLAPSLLPGTVEDVFASLSGNVRKIC